MAMKLLILVGTVTGNAEYAAQSIELACADLCESIEVRLMDGLGPSVFDEQDTLFLICTSTYGAGDVPDNAAAFFAALDQSPRYLGHVRYGVLALGDRAGHGSTFCAAGHAFDERLGGLGARRLGELACHDIASDPPPETFAVAWARDWLVGALAAISEEISKNQHEASVKSQ